MGVKTKIHPEFIINEKGKKKSVVLPISEYEELLQEINDLADVAERKNEKTKKHAEFVMELKANGYL